MRDLLSERGSIYIHIDYRVVHFMRLMLDELFGPFSFQNHIIWHYIKGASGNNRFGRKHQDILLYSRTDDFVFNRNEIGIAYNPETLARARRGEARYNVTAEDLEARGKNPGDVWSDIYPIQGNGVENIGYDTQKPEKLLERIILASSTPNSIVADFFCGSGTTLAVAEKLGRRWIGADLGRWGVHVTRKRLLGIPDAKPFEVLNLGRYERQYWQGVTFGGQANQEVAVFQYIAFVLKLYGAEPLAGLQHLHGKKGHAVVHVGAVDAPITIDEINSSVAECRALRQTELHVLGWEWEMGLYDLMTAEAKRQGVKLLLRNIPREVMEQEAVDRGDVRFFELAFLQAEIGCQADRQATVTLQDFVLPNSDLIPQEVREKITRWSDYIDYWAVDWDFRDDTFTQGWVAYRTRKERRLPLNSDVHTYAGPGSYRLLVKVVDVFGNDTSQAYELEVR